MRQRVGALILVALVMSASSALGYVFLWNDTRWADGQIDMHLQLGSSGPLIDGSRSWGDSADRALRAWNSALRDSDVSFRARTDSSSSIAAGNRVNNVIFSDTLFGRSFGGSTLAVAQVWRSRNRVVEGDVVFNDTREWNSYQGSQRGSVFDFHRVALHEFGHVLGLGHPDQDGQRQTAVMNSRISSIDRLTSDDQAGGRALYGGGGSAAPAPAPAPKVPTCDAQRIREGRRTRGKLDRSDCAAPHRSGRRADLYSFKGRRRRRVNITMAGRTLADPYLILLGPSGSVIATNDDGGSGEDAWIRDLRLPTSGTYTIEATAYRKRQFGKYDLRVDVSR